MPDRRGIKGLETEVRAQRQPEAIAKTWPTRVWLQEKMVARDRAQNLKL